MRKLVICLVLGLTLTGCGVPAAYIRADRATYNAIAPEYAQCTLTDPNLSQAQKDMRIGLLDSWNSRILHAEGALTTPSILGGSK